MWIASDRLQMIDAALEGGRRDDVDRLLADILASDAAPGRIPTACPSCRRDLIRNPLPAVGLYVSTCPDRHGAWMTADVVETLRGFVAEHATLAAKKRHQLLVAALLLLRQTTATALGAESPTEKAPAATPGHLVAWGLALVLGLCHAGLGLWLVVAAGVATAWTPGWWMAGAASLLSTLPVVVSQRNAAGS